MKNAGELYKKLEESAKNCPFCRAKEHVRSVRVGFEDEIIAEYECRNAECKFHRCGLRSYRRMLPKEVTEIKELMTEEELRDILKKVGAATAAEIKCPECGEAMRYIETDLLRNGRLVHRFECQNRLCIRKREIFIELTDEDCRKIRQRQKEKNVCGKCGERITGAVMHCPKYGIIHEGHCGECEHLLKGTSLHQCLYESYAEREKKEGAKAKECLERAFSKN